ncbi:MAG: heterocyst frequency control protein PatD [Leptolyngbyaceae cyanobacterium SL_7_1]|nr:heterocyst frequency control protein PatD [Leptolyngbyaceae cyanobacterium SL_7_1]
MLLESFRQSCDAFHRALKTLQTIATQANLNGTSLQTAFLEVQQLFQLHIASADLAPLDPAIATKLQSLLVEINKQLRLIGVDIMFLQAARQPPTAQKRQKQLSDRLQLLSSYCTAIRELVANH